MSVWNAAVFGLVRGLTEFFPVSSSGHFSMIDNLFNLTSFSDGHLFFEALLHLAMLLSVLIIYWQELTAMVRELLGLGGVRGLGSQSGGIFNARSLIMLVVASLPMLLSLPLRDQLQTLSGRNIFVGVAVVLTGCVLYTADKMPVGKKTERNMTLLDALIIGLCQCVSVIPGMSRSANTITAGLATGLRKDFAVKFSMLLSIPVLVASNVRCFAGALREGIDWHCVPAYLVGMAVSIAAAVSSITVIRSIAKRGKFGGFAYYCWVLGVLSIILSMIF